MASSSSRALNAILPLISSAPYEAHQKARTFASRYVKSNQYDTAIDVLFQTSRELLKVGQVGSGVDLAGFLLDVYETKGETLNAESRGRLTQLFALTGSAGVWRKTIVEKALAWSTKHGDYPAGDPELHHYIGELLYKEGDFETAESHFLAAGTRDSARLLAEMFHHWASETGGVPGPFALRGLIPYLLNGNILAAKTFISQFASSFSKEASRVPVGSADEILLTSDSEVNFAQVAVATCQRAQGDKNKVMRESWVRLCGTYQSRGGILAQNEVKRALQGIGELYFGLPAPRNPNANPLGDMMASFLRGGGSQTQPRRILVPAPRSDLD